MRALVTGANGFIGKNLIAHLREQGIESVPFVRGMSQNDLAIALKQVDFVFHLAGVNRPQNISEFTEANVNLTEQLCELIRASGRSIPILFTSSIQVGDVNPYGVSKLSAEELLISFGQEMQSPVYIYRLPNVFGKWSKPNYNSVVATFCYNIAHGLPIRIDTSDSLIQLVYIDDLVRDFLRILVEQPGGVIRPAISPVYQVSIGELANHIKLFKASRSSLVTGPVGVGLVRALYSTYLSFLSSDQFSYLVPLYEDSRGRFVEILKTKDSGQFSFFTAHPGATRGGHYHHSKTEKFMVIQGKARFGFRNLISGEVYELHSDAKVPEIVETPPGWSHDITNIGNVDLIVIIWANEVFDRMHPDTIPYKVLCE